MNRIKIIIPEFEGEIAPCFDAASQFRLFNVESGKIVDSANKSCDGAEAFDRVRMALREKVDVLICGGINQQYRDILKSHEVIVISRLTGTVDGALKAFLAGELYGPDEEPIYRFMDSNVSLADILRWSMETFISNGFKVASGEGYAAFPIDLVAEIECPVCGKPIRTAVCCGGHIFRADEEIQAFHHAATSDFNARVYVRPASQEIKKCCREFDVQLMEPHKKIPAYMLIRDNNRVPLLKSPINGHEKL